MLASPKKFIAPYLIQKLRARKNLLGMFGKEIEQIKFLARQIDFARAHLDATRARINSQFAVRERAL